MTTDPQTAVDFDGCNRKCRLAGAHTLVWGECEHAAQPEPTVSLSRVYTDADGFPAIGFDTYTVQQLGELITAGVRASDLPVNGDDLVDVGLVAAHAIFNRNEAASAAAVPVAAPPTTEQTALRNRIRRALCEASGNGFMWGSDMLEPDEYGEVADAVLAVLPATAEEHRLALSEAFGLGTGAPWDAICERVEELRRIRYENLRRAERAEAEVERLRADRAATLREAADFVRGLLLTRTSITTAGLEAELRTLAVEAERAGGPSREATEPQPEPTAEEIARANVLALHQIGEQLAGIESWMWEHLADVRDAHAPAVSSRPGTEQEA